MWLLSMFLLLSAPTCSQEPVEAVAVTGSATNSEDGSVVPRGTVALYDRSGAVFNLHIRDGRFSGNVAVADGYHLQILAPGFADFRLDNVSVYDGMEPIVLKLRPARVLRGQVVDTGGRGLALVRVCIALDAEGENVPMGVLTDDDGFFKMAFATNPGVYYLLASRSGYENESVAFEHPTDREVRIELRAKPIEDAPETGSVEGVLTLGGRPLADQTVWLMPAAGGSGLAARSDDRGKFRFVDAPVGKYWLEHLSDDPSLPKLSRHSRLDLEVKADQPTSVDFALSEGRLRGVVLDVDGEPVKGLRLSLSAGYTESYPLGDSPEERQAWRRRGVRPLISRDAETDDEGNFDFAGLEPGSYLLRIRSGPESTHQEFRMSVEVPDDNGLRIVLKPALTLRGVLLDQTGEIVKSFNYQMGLANESGSGVSASVDSLQGLFTIGGLKPGLYSFQVNLPDGRDATCVIDLNRGTSILFQMPAVEGMDLGLRYER